MSAPPELEQIVFRSGASSPERVALHHIAAAISIRESLACLNQLIYQAVIGSGLPVLSENNVINVKQTSTAASLALDVLYQPDDKAGV